MSKTETATAGLATQYAAQVATDLENNLKEQERISGDITALQEQLATLQHEHAVLVNVQQALGVEVVPHVRPKLSSWSVRERGSTAIWSIKCSRGNCG
ncbi:hypothetical protein ACFC08_38555 [Streptomyces sp. NPDC056112]|uniref:hypothetical protein n=1 Tax=Streptomyces sp. NPDC056112 TaxID=3345715 RepID=UPI0035E1BD56